MTLDEYAAHGPAWVLYWMYWMGFINFAAIFFVWKKVEARWILAAMIANMVFMGQFLFPTYGYVRLLGLSHIIFWTPLAIYLFRRNVFQKPKGIYDLYLLAVLITISVSLVFDYIDLARYLMGETDPMVVLPPE